VATNRLPVASRNRHDNSTINLEIGARPQAACGSTLTVGLQSALSALKTSSGLFAQFCYFLPMLTLDHSPVRSDPRALGGTLTFRGTRVKAQTLLDYLDAGDTMESFLEDYPTVSRTDATLFLQLAREESYSR